MSFVSRLIILRRHILNSFTYYKFVGNIPIPHFEQRFTPTNDVEFSTQVYLKCHKSRPVLYAPRIACAPYCMRPVLHAPRIACAPYCMRPVLHAPRIACAPYCMRPVLHAPVLHAPRIACAPHYIRPFGVNLRRG